MSGSIRTKSSTINVVVGQMKRLCAFNEAVVKNMSLGDLNNFAILDIDLREGNVNDFDPGFPNIEFAAKSFIATVRKHRDFKIIKYMGFTMLKRIIQQLLFCSPL